MLEDAQAELATLKGKLGEAEAEREQQVDKAKAELDALERHSPETSRQSFSHRTFLRMAFA